MRRPLVAYSDGPGTLTYHPGEATKLLANDDVELFFGWVLEETPWLADLPPDAARAMMGGPVLNPHIARGAIRYAPIRVASMPRMIRGPLRPDLLVVRGRPRGSGFTFCSAIGWSHLAGIHASSVVVLVDDDFPDLGGPEIEGNIIATVESDFPEFEPRERPPTDQERIIGETVASLIPSGATIQYGPGGIGNAIIESLRHPVSVWSGLATNSLVGLAERGLLRGQVNVGYLWGGPQITAMAVAGGIRVRPVQELHNIGELTRIQDFVAVNTAIEVGLDGSVNVERSGGRIVAGVGGHADFCAAASYNPTGLSIIALSSQHKGRSTIIPSVPVVSTARIDIDIVVTEHGTADLRGKDDLERARLLIAIADPSHREVLTSSISQ